MSRTPRGDILGPLFHHTMHTHDPAFVTAALERAVKAVGMPEVAKRLNAPAALIRDCMNKHVGMPDRKVMELMDLLGEIDERPPTKSRS